MGDTSTTHGARDHARSQAESAAAEVTNKPTVPIETARNLPDGVSIESLVWDETLGPGGYASRILERGSRLRTENVAGDGCAALLVFNADNPAERLNIADTVKVQWQAYLGEGALLLSDMGRVMMSITRDTSGHHDAFCGCSSEKSNAAKYGNGANSGPHPNGRDRFALALAKHGLGKRDVCANVNLFKSVRVEKDGTLTFVAREPAAGELVELRAEMRVIVVVVNVPHVLDPRDEYVATAIRLTAWRGEVTDAGDAVRNSSPERLRAFQNTEDLYTR